MFDKAKSKDYMVFSIITLVFSLLVVVIKLAQTKKLVHINRVEGWLEGFESAKKANLKKKEKLNETCNS